MIPSRFLVSVVVSAFSLALGAMALYAAPRRRLNRIFAYWNFAVATGYGVPAFLFWAEMGETESGLLIYRILQFTLPLSGYFLVGFIQDYTGVFWDRKAVGLRRLFIVCLAAAAPFYLTSLFIRGYSMVDRGGDVALIREMGPLYPFNVGIFLLIFMIAVAMTVKGFFGSAGIKRNQMALLVLAVGFGALEVTFNVLSFRIPELWWIYMAAHLAMAFCFAVAIFRFRLFEFGLWFRRLSLYSGIYAVLAGLPVLAFFPLREAWPEEDQSFWILLAAFVVTYGVLFSIAPVLTSYLRRKAEQKRWDLLHEQLALVTNAIERLPEETDLQPKNVASRVLRLMRELYWSRVNTPLAFLLVALTGPRDEFSIESFPPLRIDEAVLADFIRNMERLPSAFLKNPFTILDIENELKKTGSAARGALLNGVNRYMADNKIEVCCPCRHEERFYGVLLLGAKRNKVFWPEELMTIQMAASQAALAIGKYELLNRNRQLVDLDQIKTDLIANVTHEFKSPLNVVENAVEFLLDDMREGAIEREKITAYLKMIQNNTSRLSVFIQNLLDIANMERASENLKVESCDLNVLVRETVQLLEPFARKKNIRLDFQLGETGRLSADQEKIKQVISNLIDNAIKFTDRGRVTVSTEQIGSRVQLCVTDTGRGIDAAYLDEVFSRFFRAPQDDQTYAKGTGLGLAIAKGWVEAHGGRIWVESEGLRRGSSFSVELPAAPADEGAE